MNHTDEEKGGPCWLVIATEEERKVFVFRPEDDHAIVVGSEPDAHFRLKGVAALCFFVERVDGRLQLVPGYVGNLRLNSHQVTERVTLPPSGIVEFGRFRLNVEVQEVPPHEDDVTVFLPVSPQQSGRASDERYDEAMATSVAQFEPPSDANDVPTTAIVAPPRLPDARVSASIEFALTDAVHNPHAAKAESYPLDEASNRCPSLEDDHPALATQIVGSLFEVDESSSHRSDSTATEIGTDRTEGIPFQDFVPSTGKAKAVRPEGRIESRAHGSGEKVPPVLSPRVATRQRTSSFSGLRGSMNRLGTWVQTRPAVAIGGAVTGALILGLAIGGVNKLISPAVSTARPPSIAPGIPTTPSVTEKVAVDVRSKDRSELGPPSNQNEVSTSPEEAKEEDELRAAEEKTHADEVNRAVEHLVAGRDDEAAHAYQSIAQTKYASDELKRMSEIMQRRMNAQHKKKPAASQVPELYR